MDMLKCSECGNLFEDGEQKRWTESHGEMLEGCPVCFAAYDEIERCKVCGSYEHDAESDYCEKCIESVNKRFVDFVHKQFTENELDLLNILYDGERL